MYWICPLFQNEMAYDNVFEEASFKTYIFKLRAKVETYNVSPLSHSLLMYEFLTWLMIKTFSNITYSVMGKKNIV